MKMKGFWRLWDGGKECRPKAVNIEELEGEETVRLQEGWHCSYSAYVQYEERFKDTTPLCAAG